MAPREGTEEHVLITERTRLVPLAEHHVTTLIRHWAPEDIQRYLGTSTAFTWEKVNEVVGRSDRDFERRGFGIWAMCETDTDETLGAFGLRSLPDETKAELLWGLRPRYRGRALTHEGLTAVLDYAFREVGLAEVLASHSSGLRLNTLRALGATEADKPHETPRVNLSRDTFMARASQA